MKRLGFISYTYSNSMCYINFFSNSKVKKIRVCSFFFTISIFFSLFCRAQNYTDTVKTVNNMISKIQLPEKVKIQRDVILSEYFEYMDSLVQQYNTLVPYPLSEHLLVRTNPWIIDTLANTDYYRMMAKDSFVYDQRKMIILAKGSILKVPDSLKACQILKDFEETRIDVNIPEYKLRVLIDSIIYHTFPIRVGRNAKRYLAMGNRITDLRTKHGKGHIIRHIKNPDFYNPVDGKQFYLTKRDDGKITRMPQIPWLETEINGQLYGQMIHPTTNPETLEKAYSNGCIGITEADAWILYYYAPLGTQLEIRYDLKVKNINGEEYVFKNIYGYGN